MTTTRDRARGSLIGLAVGDAVGTAVEFKPPGSFAPVTDMTGGGTFRLEPGQFTDDTSMALCLAESLSVLGRFDVSDQLERYVRWWRDGHLSSNGRCFDIGNATRAALSRFEATGDLVATDEQAAGNGSLMRLAPAALFARGDEALAAELAARSSLTTHGAPQATDACRLFAVMLTRAVAGASKQELLDPGLWTLGASASGDRGDRARLVPEAQSARDQGKRLRRALPRGRAVGVRAQRTFAEGCLLAVNLGDDADTTAAVYGQIAGAHYGESGNPGRVARQARALGDGRRARRAARALAALDGRSVARCPTLHAYWVEPGVLLAGEYPGARTEAEAERKLRSLLDVGVRRFVDLTEEGELEAYAPLLQRLARQRGVQRRATPATRSATSTCRATTPR